MSVKDILKGVNHCEDCIDDYKKAKVNCSVCGTSFRREDEYYIEDRKHSKKNFCCEECYVKYLNEMDEKDKMIEWLKKVYNTDTLPQRIYMQMDDFKNKKKISYKWCFATLRYLVEIKGDTLKEGTIGLVPYVYDECKEYVIQVNRSKRLAKESDNYKAKFTDNVVIIKDVDIEKQREKVIQRNIITEEDLKGVLTW